MQPVPDEIANLAKAAFDFAVAAFVLAVVATFILQALHELFLRRLINGWLVRRWLRRRWPAARLFEDVSARSSFNLPYRQLCGQLGAALNTDIASGEESDLMLALAQSGPGTANETTKGSDSGKAARLHALALRAERGIDELQEHIGTRWIRINYLLALLIVAVIVAMLIYAPNTFNPVVDMKFGPIQIMLISVGAVASLIVPIGQRLIEPFIAAR
jgi:hypothetical protein